MAKKPITKTAKTKIGNLNEHEKKSFGTKIKNFFGLNKPKPVDLPMKPSANQNQKVKNKNLNKEKKSLSNKIRTLFQRKKDDDEPAPVPKPCATVPITAKSTEPASRIKQLRDDLEMERKKRIDETKRSKQHYQSLSNAKDKLIEQLNKDFELERKKLITEKNQRISAQIECIKQLRKQLTAEKALTKSLKEKYSAVDDELHKVACKYIMGTSITAHLKKTHQELMRIKNTKSTANKS